MYVIHALMDMKEKIVILLAYRIVHQDVQHHQSVINVMMDSKEMHVIKQPVIYQTVILAVYCQMYANNVMQDGEDQTVIFQIVYLRIVQLDVLFLTPV